MMMSGFYGVVFSDLFQTALIIVGIIFISFTAFFKVDNSVSFMNMAQDLSGLKEWGTAFPQMLAEMPRGYEVYETLMMFTMFLVCLLYTSPSPRDS